MTRYSLRTRLVAVVVSVTIFALLAGGLATWISLHQYLYGRLDRQLQIMVDLSQNNLNDAIESGRPVSVSGFLGGGPAGPGGGLARQTVLNRDGSVGFDTANLLAVGKQFHAELLLTLTQSDAKMLATHQDTIYSLTATDGVSMRVESKALVGGLVVVAGTPMTGVDETLTQLLVLELAVGGAAVLAAIALGTYGVRVGLHPLTRVSHTAREIATNLKDHGSGLERRVEPGNPRTEVGQLTDALNTMLGAAQVAYAQRVENEDRMRRFLADASHELRTPLTSLRGYAELERMRAATPGAEDADATKDALRRIETEGDRMARLVNDLLLLARTDQGSTAPELRPVAVDELLDEAADRAGAAYPARPFVVDTPHTGLVFVGDREAILQVLGNLLRNAAIHTPGPRPIRLGARPDGNSVVLLIADEGPGMSPEQAAHAFERFWRADSGRTRATGGSGLGLAIVHALVTAQHGVVGLTSGVATGTTVMVRMPGLLDRSGRLVHQPPPDAEYADSLPGGPVARPGPPSRLTAQPAYRGEPIRTGRHAVVEPDIDSPYRPGHWWTREEAEWRGSDHTGPESPKSPDGPDRVR